LLCNVLVSLLPKVITIIEKAYLSVFVCHNTSSQISAAFLFDPLLGLREALGDVASFWLAGLGLGELPCGLLGAASLSEASLVAVGAMTANCPNPVLGEASLVLLGAVTANCPDPLALLSDPAAQEPNAHIFCAMCYVHCAGLSVTMKSVSLKVAV